MSSAELFLTLCTAFAQCTAQKIGSLWEEGKGVIKACAKALDLLAPTSMFVGGEATGGGPVCGWVRAQIGDENRNNAEKTASSAGAVSNLAYFLQQLINGLTLGAIYGLIAIGYTMVYGIIGMINFAHGEIYMIGAFVSVVTYLVLSALGLGYIPLVLLVMLVASMLFISVYGWSIDRFAYRPLRGAP